MSEDILVTSYKIPLSVINAWPTANYIDPPRRIWAAPFSVALLGLTTLVMVARIYARITRAAGAFGLDDALILCAWVRLRSSYASEAINGE